MPHRDQIIKRLETEYSSTWKSLQHIQGKFATRGFKLFLVGGAIRNLVLGTALKDFDLASDALPDDVIAMFRHVIPTGIQHGTVTLVHQGEHFEITTFRLDGDYSDARRPDSVSFTPDILADLTRRDFTINAMALDLGSLELLDPHNGQDDLAAGLIRTVGAPLERFSEDGLRIVRGIRFAAQLDFHIESQSYAAMKLCLDKLAKVSIERFRDELFKTLDSALPSRGLYLMAETGVFPLFIEAVAQLDAKMFALCALTVDLLPHDQPELRLAACLMFLNIPDLEKVCMKLKLSNAVSKFICLMVSLLDTEPDAEMSSYKLRTFAARAGRDQTMNATLLLMAKATALDWLAWNPYTPPHSISMPLASQSIAKLFASEIPVPWATIIDELRSKPDNRLVNFQAHMERVLASNPPLAIRDLAINGAALIKAGIPAGRSMGRLLEMLLQAVLEKPENNRPEWLLAEARRFHETNG